MVQRAVNHCDHCNVDVDAALPECPLCHKPLTETPAENDMYGPVRPQPRPRRTFYQDLLVFLSIFFVTGALAVNLLNWNGTPWFVAVAAMMLCVWIELRIVAGKLLFGTKIFLQFLVICILTFTLDALTGWNGWSLRDCFPLAVLGSNVAIDLYAYHYKSRWRASLLYGLLFAFLGLVPLILYQSHVTDAALPAALCLISSVLSLLGMLRFALWTMGSELRRRLHI